MRTWKWYFRQVIVNTIKIWSYLVALIRELTRAEPGRDLIATVRAGASIIFS